MRNCDDELEASILNPFEFQSGADEDVGEKKKI